METLFIGVGIAVMALGITASTIFSRWIEHKEKLVEHNDKAARKMAALSDENQQLTEHVSLLHDRLANLERIATERESGTARLSNEIESLRN